MDNLVTLETEIGNLSAQKETSALKEAVEAVKEATLEETTQRMLN